MSPTLRGGNADLPTMDDHADEVHPVAGDAPAPRKYPKPTGPGEPFTKTMTPAAPADKLQILQAKGKQFFQALSPAANLGKVNDALKRK